MKPEYGRGADSLVRARRWRSGFSLSGGNQLKLEHHLADKAARAQRNSRKEAALPFANSA